MSKYKCVRQNEPSECGASCIATICLQHKRKINTRKLRDTFGSDIECANEIELASMLVLLGFDAKACKGTKETLEQHNVFPAIVSIVRDGVKQFVVLHKISSEYMILADPALGTNKIEKELFYNIFTGDIIICNPTENFEYTKKNDQRVTYGLSKVLSNHKPLVALAVISSIILIMLSVLASLFGQVLIDELLPYNLDNQLLIFCIGLGVIGLFSIIIKSIRQHLLVFLGMKIDIPLMLSYYRRLFKLPIKNYETRRTGEVLTRAQDATQIKDVYTTISLSLTIDIILALFVGVILFFLNQTLFYVAAVIALVHIIAANIFKYKYRKLSNNNLTSTGSINSKIVESLNSVETIKSFGLEHETYNILERRYMQTIKNSYKTSVVSSVQSTFRKILNLIGILTMMFFGVQLVSNGSITNGELFAFLALGYYFLEPMCRLTLMQKQLQESKMAKKRLDAFYEIDIEDETISFEDIDISGDIVIKNLEFKHNNRAPIIKDVNLTIKNKSKVALVGPTGSGKSTLAKILVGLWNYEKGSIKINDFELSGICKNELRKKIAYVPQNVELFTGSILDNIKIGAPDATLEEVKIATALSGCDQFLSKLPAGLDSYVEEDGHNISGGEKQRIALARAIIKNPEVLIIDEATTNLDLISESLIVNNICNLNATVIFITHRLSTIIQMDEIVVIENKVTEIGTHEELISNESTYYNMFTGHIDDETANKATQTIAKAIATYNETLADEEEAKLNDQEQKLLIREQKLEEKIKEYENKEKDLEDKEKALFEKEHYLDLKQKEEKENKTDAPLVYRDLKDTDEKFGLIKEQEQETPKEEKVVTKTEEINESETKELILKEVKEEDDSKQSQTDNNINEDAVMIFDDYANIPFNK